MMTFCAFFMMKAASSAEPSFTGRASPLGPPAAAISPPKPPRMTEMKERDRKSTRVNSSHVKISYAVFCLKKKVVYRSRLALERGSEQTVDLLLDLVHQLLAVVVEKLDAVVLVRFVCGRSDRGEVVRDLVD